MNIDHEGDCTIDFKNIDVNNVTGFIPPIVLKYLDLWRQYQLCEADIKKSKIYIENITKKIENGILKSDEEMNQSLHDTSLQYEIIDLIMK